jgi:hypothetical protein
MSNVYILFIPGFFIMAASGLLNILTTGFWQTPWITAS